MIFIILLALLGILNTNIEEVGSEYISNLEKFSGMWHVTAIDRKNHRLPDLGCWAVHIFPETNTGIAAYIYPGKTKLDSTFFNIKAYTRNGINKVDIYNIPIDSENAHHFRRKSVRFIGSDMIRYMIFRSGKYFRSLYLTRAPELSSAQAKYIRNRHEDIKWLNYNKECMCPITTSEPQKTPELGSEQGKRPEPELITRSIVPEVLQLFYDVFIPKSDANPAKVDEID